MALQLKVSSNALYLHSQHVLNIKISRCLQLAVEIFLCVFLQPKWNEFFSIVIWKILQWLCEREYTIVNATINCGYNLTIYLQFVTLYESISNTHFL